MASTDNIGFIKVIQGPRKTLSNNEVEIETTINDAIKIGPIYLICTQCAVTLKKKCQANFDHVIHIDGLIPNPIEMSYFGFLEYISQCTYTNIDNTGLSHDNVYYVDLSTDAIDNTYQVIRFNPTTDFKNGTVLNLQLFRILKKL